MPSDRGYQPWVSAAPTAPNSKPGSTWGRSVAAKRSRRLPLLTPSPHPEVSQRKRKLLNGGSDLFTKGQKEQGQRGPRESCACVPSSEASRRTARCASQRNKIPQLRRSLWLEHGLVQLGFCQKPFKAGVFLLQLRQPLSLFCLHNARQQTPTVIAELVNLEDAADIGNVRALAIS